MVNINKILNKEVKSWQLIIVGLLIIYAINIIAPIAILDSIIIMALFVLLVATLSHS